MSNGTSQNVELQKLKDGKGKTVYIAVVSFCHAGSYRASLLKKTENLLNKHKHYSARCGNRSQV